MYKKLLASVAAVAAAAIGYQSMERLPKLPVETPLPNVAIVLLDDVGLYDISVVATPTIDLLRSTSHVFPRANTTASMCSPSRTALTGQYGRRFGIGRIITKTEPNDLPTGTNTIASRLQAEGYTTCHVGKWHLSSGLNYDLMNAPAGFGFDNWRAMATHNPAATTPGGTYFNWGRIDDGVETITDQYITEAQSEAAIDWWTTTTGPKFLWLAYTAAHDPFHVPPVDQLPPGYVVPANPGNREMFEAMIATVDHSMLDVLNAFDDGNTIVIFWSDNGTPQNAVDATQDPLKVKQSLYQGGISTPMVLHLPDQEQGQTHRRLVSSVDIYKTVLDLAGVTSPDLDSLSFSDSVGFPSTTAIRQYNFAERFGPNGPGPYNARERMVRDIQGYKLIIEEDLGVETFRALFHLSTDPTESNPITDPVKEAELEQIMFGI